ncbi:MAG: MerR family transcriptional regulator [Bdellovibrio sp.]|nr:MerR family transcriptional regulator [Bdellovibrio sp.]
MLSIGQFADKAQVSARTVRYYESIGLLPTSNRGENNYRFYSEKLLERMNRIRDLQGLGFSLDDIKIIISFSDSELKTHLQERLLQIEHEIENLADRRQRVQNLLSVSNKIETGEILTETERNLYMDSLKEEVISGLRSRYHEISDSAVAYLKRDTWLDSHPGVGEFISAVKKCTDFAKRKNLILGTARGSSPASMSFYGLGFSVVDPLKYEMLPERLLTQKPFFHIDVEYERGQEFVDFCRDVNRTLSYGEIQAFKMPLIDVIQNTHKAMGQVIDYDTIQDDSDIVLSPFKNGDFEKIFQFDFSPDALVMNYDKFFPEFLGLKKIEEHFKDQTEFSFRDIINITALWRPHTQELINRIDLYRDAKKKTFSYGFLSEKIEKWLQPNHGVVIYHEDIMKIISEYTGWELSRSNALRRTYAMKTVTERDQDLDWIVFQKVAPTQVVDLVAEESKLAFCMPHAIAFAKFTKQTAVLKTLHKSAYFEQIERFEQKHGFKWDDIGIRINGVSLHQG